MTLKVNNEQLLSLRFELIKLANGDEIVAQRILNWILQDDSKEQIAELQQAVEDLQSENSALRNPPQVEPVVEAKGEVLTG